MSPSMFQNIKKDIVTKFFYELEENVEHYDTENLEGDKIYIKKESTTKKSRRGQRKSIFS